jgi:hypothetical protein
MENHGQGFERPALQGSGLEHHATVKVVKQIDRAKADN